MLVRWNLRRVVQCGMKGEHRNGGVQRSTASRGAESFARNVLLYVGSKEKVEGNNFF